MSSRGFYRDHERHSAYMHRIFPIDGVLLQLIMMIKCVNHYCIQSTHTYKCMHYTYTTIFHLSVYVTLQCKEKTLCINITNQPTPSSRHHRHQDNQVISFIPSKIDSRGNKLAYS